MTDFRLNHHYSKWNKVVWEGSKFAFDGIVYLNLVLSNEKGETFELSYELVLVSSQVSPNILGFH